MPVTLVDRLPLPNLKVYTAGSVLLLSVAVYYALNVTSDPNWRTNATLVRADDPVEGDGAAGPALVAAVSASVAADPQPLATLNDTRNLTEQFVEVMTFMMQEPLCMWTLINIAYCSLAVFGFAIQRLVFGQLRVAEAQRVKDKFWNYVFYKFIFVFGVINVQYMDEVLLWCSWFTLLGFLHLLGQLCRDRFEYLCSSPTAAAWAHVRLALLLGGILAAGGALLGAAAVFGLAQGRDTFAFMAAECVLVCVSALHVCARYSLQLLDADVAGAPAYYTHLAFDSAALVVELAHVVHMVVYSNLLVSMASLVLLMQLRHLLHELQARLQRHRLYTERATHITRHCPMASKEEVEKNQDNCAICWEPMKEARRLPCAHLFHNSCLCQWVQQDASCPTCRRTLSRRAAPPAARPRRAARPPHNHLFHFDGSRYVSWLPSFSVEVTRVPAEPAPAPAQLDAMARQVQQLFPQFPLRALAEDLAASRSADLTVDNILEGRLQPPRAAENVPEPAGAATQLHTNTASPPAASATLLPHALAAASSPVHSSTQTLGRLADRGVGTATPVAVNFSLTATERESLLRRRKDELIAAARTRYLAKRANCVPAPANSVTALANNVTAPANSVTTSAAPHS